MKHSLLERIEQLEQLAAKATEGPWINAFPHSGVVVQDDNDTEQTFSSVLEPGKHTQRWQDLDFAAASREAIPALEDDKGKRARTALAELRKKP